jgi:tRNA (guanine-N7-)-methyltransferase
MEQAPAKAASAPLSAVYRPASYVKRLDLAQLFSRLQPLEVELGCGDGSFLVQWAKLHPEHNYLAVERLLGRLRKVDRKAQRAGLANVRLLRIEASYFMEYLLPPESVRALHIYFPDPWPKRRHRKHRLVNAHFVEVAARMLKPQGTVFLRTDDLNYFEQMKSVFESHHLFQDVGTPSDLGATLTDFERDFQTRGVVTLRAAYQCTKGNID